ncbi:hypothetical protein BDV26DRAFT_90327 [Aspergillus bertholletiae]|uniref:Uncharacterized protein n=1 Tax=Aspergillus bertholletiae TaxID=1226010 RepID=A0A5N7ARZ4_9EURO|nr:hypothetical protein BDV26DRAFT_90327 [Aspergillus bertholletiae]
MTLFSCIRCVCFLDGASLYIFGDVLVSCAYFTSFWMIYLSPLYRFLLVFDP